jgi:hypothetical protein
VEEQAQGRARELAAVLRGARGDRRARAPAGRSQHPRRLGRARRREAGGAHRPARGRLRRRAQVSQPEGDGAHPARRAPLCPRQGSRRRGAGARGGADAGQDGRGRHLRTRCGWCRTSRRCSTTTRSSSCSRPRRGR